MTLYLKYRPKNLDELDESSVSESLKKIIAKKNIPHAFLFAGPKGTGKTSAARILAKIINCEDLKDGVPCDKCNQCVSTTKGSNLDVIEMDAASHRGIDDVRILRDAVKLAPVSGKKKIYIIDEVHMLTTEASNALLKTLEEPPEHVVFILATTNPEKLIETIRSRTTLIQFSKASPSEIVRSLKRVVDGEKIKITDDALLSVAEAADGAFRDAIKILEQLVVEEKELTKESIDEYLYKNKSFDLQNFVLLLKDKNAGELVSEISKIVSKGVSVEYFLESLIKKLRKALLFKIGIGDEDIKEFTKDELMKLIDLFNKAYSEMGSMPIEELPLEIAVITWCKEEDSKVEEPDDSEEKTEVTIKVQNIEISEEPKVIKAEATDNVVPIQEQAAISADMKVEDGAWKNILEQIKPINASMEALLRSSKPLSYNGRVLTLGVYYKFHKERLEESKHRKILEEVVGKVLQSATKVCCVLVEPPPKKVFQESRNETILTENKDKNIADIAEKMFSN